MKKNSENFFSMDSNEEFENDYGYDANDTYDEFDDDKSGYSDDSDDDKYADYADEWEEDYTIRPKKMRKNSQNDWDWGKENRFHKPIVPTDTHT